MTYALFDRDNEALEDLMFVINPDEQDIVTLGALAKRYPQQSDLGMVIRQISAQWGFTEEALELRCREIWASGFRPSHNVLNQEES